MKPDKVFKRYDVRGEYPEELDEEFAERMGTALASLIENRYKRTVVVGKDTKKTSESLKNSLIDGLTSSGINVADIGTGTTDMASFHCEKHDCVGIQVTSSHMPLDFNGMKFMYPEGNGFVNEDLNKLEHLFKQKEGLDRVETGNVTVEESADREYIDEMANYVKNNFEGPEERKIVFDTLGGSSSIFLPEALNELGFEVINAGKDSEKPYQDPPNPSPDNLENIENAVEDKDAYLGMGFDLDADRVAVYFEGEWVSGDDLFCVFSQLFEGKVVASIDTDSMIEEFAEEVVYTRVGDPFVISEMIESEAVLSGEPNGHYCFPQFVNYNSGLLAGLIISCLDLEERLGKIPERYTEETSIEFENRADAEEAMEDLKSSVRRQFSVLSKVDGVKFELDDCVVLARLSGSSPVMRLKSYSGSESLCVDGLEQVEKLVLG